MKKLLIVESPTKAKTIKKFLPPEYTVTSSFGHMRDLPKSSMGIDIENNFTPKYIIAKDRQKNVTELKKLAEKSDEIILASDEDREGEAISWHIWNILKENAKKKSQAKSAKTKKSLSYKRIVFHEITKSAIQKALENSREIDIHLVDAQQARRVLDRLVGYELSPFLWKKIRRGLSAGRVQSVALRFIAEREKERKAFLEKPFYAFSIQYTKTPNTIPFEVKLLEKNGVKIEKVEKIPVFAGIYAVTSSLLTEEKESLRIKNDLETFPCIVQEKEHKKTKRTPPPPFITSTLQQSAINRFGFSSKQTMRLAQKLYEKGFITYMRTDSVNLSLESSLSAKKVIEHLYGKNYALDTPRHYKSRKGAQEAHEAIRPTMPEKTPQDTLTILDTLEQKLYQLIWERMVASQMKEALIESIRVLLQARKENTSYLLSATGSTVSFEGFFALSKTSSLLGNTLPSLEKGDSLSLHTITLEEKQTTPPPRYSEASLVKILEEKEIGRPSTYAPTLSTLFDRGYIEKDENKRLYPQEIGVLVCELLCEHFSDIVDIDFTVSLEKTLDTIAEGKEKWIPVVRNFYEPFHKNLVEKSKIIEKKEIETIGRDCPECGKELAKRYGRFGSFIGCSNFPECTFIEKTKKEEVSSGVSCPTCKEGDLVQRTTRRGKIFYGCNRFPKCKTAYWDKPTDKTCSLCSSLLVEKPKGQLVCSNKECQSNEKKK
ncbi:MAG: type I DNA topoisomerase [Candidatus Moranbacteria bacterium]|nr:type I DNA topoisomerase [Candidatus Moranbacteria bacterium]